MFHLFQNSTIFNLISTFFSKGHERSIKAKRNIIASFIVKGGSIIINFIMVSVTLDYLDQTKYGIWLTLSSFLAWFSFFELGLGNGLRNKLAQALAIKDYSLGKTYVSTTYAILSIVISFVAILFFIVNNFIDWTMILNTDKDLLNELRFLSLIVFGFFFLRFVIKLIGIILYADQRPALADSFGLIGNLISLIVIYALTKTTHGSLIYLGLTLSIFPVLVLLIASFYLYSNDYKNIAPSIKYIDLKYAKDLLNLGVKFFLIQISGLIIYQSSNIIIVQFFGPDDVVIFNLSYKYFSILPMAFSIVIIPFWSAFTEAWVNNDILWIKKTINRLVIIWGSISAFGVLMLIFSNSFYALWVGDKIKIPFILSSLLFIYFVTFTFGRPFNMFINGVGKITLQMYSGLFGAIIFIVSSIVLIKFFKFGVEGLVVSMILSNFYGVLLAPIQYKKIINFNAHKIWNK